MYGYACPWTSNFIIMFALCAMTFAVSFLLRCALVHFCACSQVTFWVEFEFNQTTEATRTIRFHTHAACARLVWLSIALMCNFLWYFAEFRRLFASYDMIAYFVGVLHYYRTNWRNELVQYQIGHFMPVCTMRSFLFLFFECWYSYLHNGTMQQNQLYKMLTTAKNLKILSINIINCFSCLHTNSSLRKSNTSRAVIVSLFYIFFLKAFFYATI